MTAQTPVTAAQSARLPARRAASVEDLEAFLAANLDLESVDAVFVDLSGAIRGKRFPRVEARKIFEVGVQIPLTVYLLDARGEMTDPLGRGFGDGDPDGTAWPVPGTLMRVAGSTPARGQVLMTLFETTGEPTSLEPRNVLARSAARLAEIGLTPVTAVELEFYLLDRQRGASGLPQPPLCPDTGERERALSVYGLSDLDRYGAFLKTVGAAAAMQNVPASAATSEYGPGQFEINLRHTTDILAAGDDAVFLRQVVKAAARQHGMEATFMAKPYADRAGSGMHIHLSLRDVDGRNVFDDGTAKGSERLRHAIGGLQAIMHEAMAILAPGVNSYRRYVPNLFVPVNRHWGYNNRSTGLRVPTGVNEARRVEHRVAGADANPYLALAVVLAGAHYGIVNRIEPAAPREGNVSGEVDASVPFTIDGALEALRAAKILPDYLGAEYLRLYAESKRVELQRVRSAISPAEYEWYL